MFEIILEKGQLSLSKVKWSKVKKQHLGPERYIIITSVMQRHT